MNDPACGAGALLVAAANAFKEAGINYQQSVEFVAQDIDHVAAMMCYIQMSLLGCSGYVIVGDTLLHPPTVPLPPDYEVWYTPMYYSDVWHWRRVLKMLDHVIMQSNERHGEQIKSNYFYYYYFDFAVNCNNEGKINHE